MGNFYFKNGWLYIDFNKKLYISIGNPFKTMNKLKGVFKPLKCCFKCGKDWYPVLWVSKPSYIHIMSHDVNWKDKYDSPRYEGPPFVWIHLFGFNLVWYWTLPDSLLPNLSIDQYWEQALWYLYYNNTISQGLEKIPNIEKAKESWPWEDMRGLSTWTDIYLEK